MLYAWSRAERQHLGAHFRPVFATAIYGFQPHIAYLAAAGVAFVAVGLAWAKLSRPTEASAPAKGASG